MEGGYLSHSGMQWNLTIMPYDSNIINYAAERSVPASEREIMRDEEKYQRGRGDYFMLPF